VKQAAFLRGRRCAGWRRFPRTSCRRDIQRERSRRCCTSFLLCWVGRLYRLAIPCSTAAANESLRGSNVLIRSATCTPCSSKPHARLKTDHVMDLKCTSAPQGPCLGGIFGRTSGTVAGFSYSAANKDAAIEWSENTLYDYLLNPKKYIPGESSCDDYTVD
jgi:hypothetical protein